MKRIPVLLALLIIIKACQSDEPARPAENNDTIQPYMDGENLHFVGTFYEDTPFMINVMDLKINF